VQAALCPIAGQLSEQHETEGLMPRPLTRAELDQFKERGLREVSFEDFVDDQTPPVRRFHAVYERRTFR
jgi:hypothetical protein